jgi:hypothetical protein
LGTGSIIGSKGSGLLSSFYHTRVLVFSLAVGLRPYYAENTGSHPNPEVKLHQAELVLGWGTTLEPSVLQALFVFWLFSVTFFFVYYPDPIGAKGRLPCKLLDHMRPIGTKGFLLYKLLGPIGTRGVYLLKLLGPYRGNYFL